MPVTPTGRINSFATHAKSESRWCRKRRRGALVYLQHKVMSANGLPGNHGGGEPTLGPCPRASAAGIEIRRCQLEPRKLEPRRHGAADQRPIAETAGLLPGPCRHDRLRPLAFCQIRTQVNG